MIVSVEKLKQHITTALDTPVLEEKLQALELLVRKYTNNNFQMRNARIVCSVDKNKLYTVRKVPFFKVGDTVQISESNINDGIYVIDSIDKDSIELNKMIYDESHCLVTLIKYPDDIQMGVINLMKWELEKREKVGIASETISRYSVTYFSMDNDNSLMGFPKSLMGFLKPYIKARF